MAQIIGETELSFRTNKFSINTIYKRINFAFEQYEIISQNKIKDEHHIHLTFILNTDQKLDNNEYRILRQELECRFPYETYFNTLRIHVVSPGHKKVSKNNYTVKI